MNEDKNNDKPRYVVDRRHDYDAIIEKAGNIDFNVIIKVKPGGSIDIARTVAEAVAQKLLVVAHRNEIFAEGEGAKSTEFKRAWISVWYSVPKAKITDPEVMIDHIIKLLGDRLK